MEHYPIIILGAGTAGYTAAVRAAQLGLNFLIIEQDKLGGTCLNYGCIPTKSLLASASALRTVKNSGLFGVHTGDISFSLSEIIDRKQKITDRLVKGIEYLFKKNKVLLKKGKASLLPNKKIIINDEIITFDKLIIASGSSAFIPENLNIGSPLVLTNKEALELSVPIDSLLIVGGGVIGCEFAAIFHSFGTKITIVELSENLLPGIDKEVSSELTKILKKEHIGLKLKTTVQTLTEENNKITAEFSDGTKQEFDRVLISAGRTPNLENLDLSSYNIEMSGPYIKVNSYYQTSHPDIFAIGDIIGPPLLAHKASHDAVSLIEYIAQNKIPVQKTIPSAVYTHPEIGTVGKTEEQLIQENQSYKKTKFSFFPVGKAKIINETQGFIKILTQDSKIVGAHIIGPQAAELIPFFTLAIDNQIPLETLSESILSHPTISETIKETIETALNKSINI